MIFLSVSAFLRSEGRGERKLPNKKENAMKAIKRILPLCFLLTALTLLLCPADWEKRVQQEERK